MAKKEEKDVGARIVELNTKVSDAKAEKTLAEKKIEEITKELKEKGIKVEDLSKTIEEKEKEMKEAALELQFEWAAALRDELIQLRKIQREQLKFE